jgi:dethiobiotin synthetase
VNGLFVTATGTGVGKTFFSCALAFAIAERGRTVAAIKPIETGVSAEPADATALARASGQPELAQAEGLVRASPPLAPYAVQKLGGPAVGSLASLAERVRELGAGSDVTLVEGAGGVLVPIDATHTMADFAVELGFPTVLVAQNALGVLSYTLTAVEALQSRCISPKAIILNRAGPIHPDDPSPQSNQAILNDYLPELPIYSLPPAETPQALIPVLQPLLDELQL